MRKGYRYFLGFRPHLEPCRLIVAIGEQVGQRVRPELVHLTLCVVAEAGERDRFVLSRIRSALAGQAFSAFPVRLGRVSGNSNGAILKALGRQNEMQDFYRSVISLLAMREIEPLHRKSGLRAHVTLGYSACDFESFRAPLEWFPSELLLIESEVGSSRHNVLARWPFLPPRQPSLPFDGLWSWQAAA
jgi:2'-5' RNA ligase